jgi:hypothetical protein
MSTNNGNDTNKSPHILNASSNLIGFSFVLFSTLQILNLGKETLIDEIAVVEMLLFSVSSLFSFMSMRISSEHKSYLYEKVADYIFFAGLITIFLSAVALLLFK